MLVQPYTPTTSGAWNEFAANAKNSHFFFQRDYMEYHRDRFEDDSLLFYDEKGRLLALLPATKHGETIISHGGLTFGGFLVGERMTVETMLDVMEATKKFLAGLGCRELIYKCMPYIYCSYPAEEDRYALFRAEAELIRRDVSTAIFLPKRYGCSCMRKRAVKKGQRQGVQVRESKDFATYIAMLNAVLQKYFSFDKVLDDIKSVTGLQL